MDSLISPSAVPCSDMGSKTPTGLQQDAGFRGVLHGAIQRQETDMQLGRVLGLQSCPDDLANAAGAVRLAPEQSTGLCAVLQLDSQMIVYSAG